MRPRRYLLRLLVLSDCRAGDLTLATLDRKLTNRVAELPLVLLIQGGGAVRPASQVDPDVGVAPQL